MSKETVVRQNRCDREMNFLLFICFFFYMAMQIFAPDNLSAAAAKGNLALYMVFVPGFFFAAGYSLAGMCRLKSEEYRERHLLAASGRCLAYYLLLSLGFLVFVRGGDWVHSLTSLLSLVTMPAVGAVFFSLAVLWILARFFGSQICGFVIRRKREAAVVTVLLLVSAMLWTDGESYVFSAAFFGSSTQPAVPLVPYFAFFLIGIWFWEHKPGFQWKIAAVSAVVTAAALVLYQTPLRPLARVAISFLPVYLVYCASELLSDLTIRFCAVRFACASIEPVFGVYSILLFALCKRTAFAGAGTARALLGGGAVLLGICLAILGFFLFSRIYGAGCIWAERKVKHKKLLYFLIYTAAFCGIAALVFFEFIRTGRSFIIKGDGVSQYYPKVIYFVRYVREIISGFLQGNFHIPMYDFGNGFGSEITVSLEPVYFLYLLFDENHLELAYNLLTVLRFYLAGLSFSALCFYFKKDGFSTFLASMVYVFCGWTLYGGSMHTMFMIPVIMLPLLILSMEEILRRRRWYLCTIFVAISLLSNYYYLYMNTIAMGIYFVVRFFCQKEKENRTVKNFFGRGLVICGSYLLGVAMSSIVLVTKFGMYLGSGRSGSAVVKVASMFYYRADWLVSCFLTFLTTANSPGEWMKYGFLPIAMLALAFLFLRKGRKELKIFSLIALAFSVFPLFGFIFSGFSAVINRWCYIAALLVAFITAECIPQMRTLEKRDKKVMAVIIAVYGLLAYFGAYKNTIYTHRAFWCLVLTFAVLLVCQESFPRLDVFGKRSLALILTVVLVAHQGYSLFHTDGRVTGYMKEGRSLSKVVDTPLAAVEELGDDSFYRSAAVTLDYYNSNAPILLDFNSTTQITSTINGNVLEYLRQMGATSFGVNTLRGLANRAFLNNPAAVKYFACFDEENVHAIQAGCEPVLKTEVAGKAVTVYENAYALPIGYTYTDTISEEELEKYSTEAKSEILMQKVLLEDAGTTGEEPAVTGKEIAIQSVEESRAYLTEHALIGGMEETVSELRSGSGAEPTAVTYDPEDKTYNLTLTFESEPNSETYLVLRNAFMKGDMSENQLKLTFRTEDGSFTYSFQPDDYRYLTGQDDFVFNLGYHEEALTSCTIKMARQGMIQFDSLSLYSQSMENLSGYTQDRTENVLENVSVSDNAVTGTINLDEDKILVLSIPYQKGWTAYVDGVKTELKKANYMYMALELGAGEHVIELQFAIPGMKAVAVIMPASLLLFLILCGGTCIRARKKRKVKK